MTVVASSTSKPSMRSRSLPKGAARLLTELRNAHCTPKQMLVSRAQLVSDGARMRSLPSVVHRSSRSNVALEAITAVSKSVL